MNLHIQERHFLPVTILSTLKAIAPLSRAWRLKTPQNVPALIQVKKKTTTTQKIYNLETKILGTYSYNLDI